MQERLRENFFYNRKRCYATAVTRVGFRGVC